MASSAAQGINFFMQHLVRYLSRSMANLERTAKSITQRAMGLLLAALLCNGALVGAALPAQAREDIEWLDVWLPHANDHDLPHVLLIGDSITRGYGPEVEKALAGHAYVGRLATSKSLGDPALPDEIELILRDISVDVIHFNNGLHGSKYTEAEYAAAIPALLAVFKRTAPAARLIWASSTDVVGPRRPEDLTLPRIAERNRLAAIVMTKRGIPIDDLFSVVSGHAVYHLADGVHFTEVGYAVLAGHVAASITSVLDGRNTQAAHDTAALLTGEGQACQPCLAARIQALHGGSRELRHVAFDDVADVGLHVSQVLIARRQGSESRAVQLEFGGRIDRIDPVLFIDRLTQHQAPAPGALRDGHLGLRDGALTRKVDRCAAQKMQNADPLGPAFPARANEIRRRTLKPGRHHDAVIVPDRGESIPIARIAPQRPVFDQFANRQALARFLVHSRPPLGVL
jgi:lysophospholipase L1-like esterase